MRGEAFKACNLAYMCNVFIITYAFSMSVTKTTRMALIRNKTNKIIQVRAGACL